MDRTEYLSGDLVDLPARPLCRVLLADLPEARRLHLDGPRRRWTVVDPAPDHAQEAQFMAARRQCGFAGAGAVWVLLCQRAAAGGFLQCGTFARERRNGPQ